MIVGRIVKETTDKVRRTINFVPVLDVGEVVSAIQSSTLILGNSGWSTQPFPTTPPADPTPVVLDSITIVNAGTAIQVYLDAGTPGNVYTLQVVALGSTSNRRWTFEVPIEITGTTTPLPAPLPRPSTNDALPIGGGNMLGPLYAFEDPAAPMEVATKRYVDNLEVEFTTDVANEAAARIAEDNILQAEISAEITRAEAAETTLTTNLATEVTRAEAAEATLTTNLATEVTRAEGAEATLTTNLATEVARAEAAEATLTTSVGTASSGLAAEITRAEAAEAELDTDIGEETTRAEAAEATLTTNLAAEVTRAEAAEATLTSAVAALGLSKYGSNTTDGTAHVRITYGSPFPAATDSFVACITGAGLYTLCIVAQADRFGADIYTSNSATAAAEGPVGFNWIAFGH